MAADNNGNKRSSGDGTWFAPLVLLIILAILLTGIRLIRELSGPRPIQPPPARITKPPPLPPGLFHPGTIAIIIDDVGWDTRLVQEIRNVKAPITLSVLPATPYGGKILDADNSGSCEYLLHVPLEPLPSKTSLDKIVLKTSMSDEEILSILRREIAPYRSHIKGVNNHMGSRFTADREKMKVFLGEIGKEHLFFIDSETTPTSCGRALSGEMGIPSARRDIFLDNSADPAAIREQLYKAVALARNRGEIVIAIGHARKNTVAVLKEEIPLLEKQGIRFVPVSAAVH